MNPPLMLEVPQLTCLALAYTKHFTHIKNLEYLDVGPNAAMTHLMKTKAKVLDIASVGLPLSCSNFNLAY